MFRLELLQAMGQAATEHARFGPGILVPVCMPGSYAQLVLDQVGDEVERDLTWEWPTAYNGPRRRAAVRARLEAQRQLMCRAAVWNPLAQMKISGITT